MRREPKKLTRNSLIVPSLVVVLCLSSVALVAQDTIHSIISGIATRQNEKNLSEVLINGLYFSAGGHEHLVRSHTLTLSPERESASVSKEFIIEVQTAQTGYSNASEVFASLVEEGYEFQIDDTQASIFEGLGYPTDPKSLIERLRDETSSISSALVMVAESSAEESYGQAIALANDLSTVVAVIGQVQGITLER
ncbi:MAG: hypothetical protein Q4P24_16870 [Rhodobacterales bacterium]|nr:hypothetical protein [Rhodobacterales bacterium]